MFGRFASFMCTLLKSFGLKCENKFWKFLNKIFVDFPKFHCKVDENFVNFKIFDIFNS